MAQAPKPRLWRPDGASAPAGRRGQAIALAAGVLALAGAVAAWVLFWSPLDKPYFLPLVFSEYGEELPVRAWARQDADALRALRWHQSTAFTRQQRDLLVGELRGLAQRGRRDTVVIYLSAYARARSDGELCLLPVDSRLDQSTGWVPVREVFGHLRACPSRQKLLLLDLMHPFLDARQGLLSNDAAERLWPLVEEAVREDPHLLVLCACSPGQVSLTSEELGHSAFGHFLLQGLSGAADGRGETGRHNDRVTARELAAYLQEEVDRWAARHQQARQTPVLWGEAKDFTLLPVLPDAAPGAAAREQAYPKWLSDGWALRDGWRRDESFGLALSIDRQFEEALLLAECQWRGGVDPERVRGDWGARQARLERLRGERLPARDRDVPSSVAKALAGGDSTPGLAKHVTSVRRLVALEAEVRKAKPDPDDVKRLAAGEAALIKDFADRSRAELAWVVLDAATEDRPTREGLRYLASLLEKGRVPRWAEVRYLNRLATEVPNGTWPAEAVWLALQTVGEAERASAAAPRDRLWARAELDGAAEAWRQAESLPFGEGNDQPGVADALKRANDRYKAVNRDLRVIEAARRARDEALVLLPGYEPYLEFEGSNEPAWERAVESARALRDALSSGDRKGADFAVRVARLRERTATLQNDPKGLQRLRHPLTPDEFKGLIRRRTRADATDETIMRGLLQTTWPSARQRSDLWVAWRDLRGQVRGDGASSALPKWDASRAVAAERVRAVARARRSVAILKLLGAEGLTDLEKALVEATRAPEDAGKAQALAERLRQSWARQRQTGTGAP